MQGNITTRLRVRRCIFHPQPEMLRSQFEGNEEFVQTEWKMVIARIKTIFAETPLKILQFGNTKKEQDRLFDQTQYIVDEIMGQFDIAVKL